MALTPRQVAERMNVREFTQLCGKLDEGLLPDYRGKKFSVIKIFRTENSLDVVVVEEDHTLRNVRVA